MRHSAPLVLFYLVMGLVWLLVIQLFGQTGGLVAGPWPAAVLHFVIIGLAGTVLHRLLAHIAHMQSLAGEHPPHLTHHVASSATVLGLVTLSFYLAVLGDILDPYPEDWAALRQNASDSLPGLMDPLGTFYPLITGNADLALIALACLCGASLVVIYASRVLWRHTETEPLQGAPIAAVALYGCASGLFFIYLFIVYLWQEQGFDPVLPGGLLPESAVPGAGFGPWAWPTLIWPFILLGVLLSIGLLSAFGVLNALAWRMGRWSGGTGRALGKALQRSGQALRQNARVLGERRQGWWPLILLPLLLIPLFWVWPFDPGTGSDDASGPEQTSVDAGLPSTDSRSDLPTDRAEEPQIEDSDPSPDARRPVCASAQFAVFFPFNDAGLTEMAERDLAEAAAYFTQIKTCAGARSVEVVIEGHADRSGDDAYNLRLSERRAQAVRDRLITFGVDADAIRIEPFGESRPAIATPDGRRRQENRRTTILIRLPGPTS